MRSARVSTHADDVSTGLPSFAWVQVGGGALLAVALLLATATRYGYHRDELYFLEGSKHMAWGYVDQPPLSIALVWLPRVLFGNSLFWLRVPPAMADGALVVVTGLIARELGASRFAQGLAALAVAVSPFLIAGHLAGPTIYDILAWAVVSLLVLRILRTGRDRLWIAVGIVAGIGLEDKETIVLLFVALAVGMLLNRQASVLRTKWLWAGLAVAGLLWTPNLVWQALHGWPIFEMSRNLRREHSGIGYAFKYPFIQLLLPGWWVAPVWIGGLVALWREERFRPYRAFAIAYALLFVLLLVLIPDRPYYLAGLYPVLLAAGAGLVADVVRGERRFLTDRQPSRRRLWRSPRTAVMFVLVAALVDLPVSLPVLPASALATVPLQKINYNLGEQIGWHEFTATIARVDRSLPPSERRAATIVTGNYGEAGAIDRYGGAYHLPLAFSGHNNYWWWGPPHPALGTTIAIGFDRSAFSPYFGSVVLAARIHNGAGVENDEEGTLVWVCTGQRRPWPAIWPQFRNYG
jgi:hypothetical protein